MLNLNLSTLNAVVEQATHDAAYHPRWLQAIARAVVELDANPWIERADHGGLLIGSPSGSVYSANGVCQCKAFEFGQPCWHRAASRIVRLCDEREASWSTKAAIERAERTAKIRAACDAFNADVFGVAR